MSASKRKMGKKQPYLRRRRMNLYETLVNGRVPGHQLFGDQGEPVVIE